MMTVDTQALSRAAVLHLYAATGVLSAALSPLGSVARHNSITFLQGPQAKDRVAEDAASLHSASSVLEPSASMEEDPVSLT